MIVVKKWQNHYSLQWHDVNELALLQYLLYMQDYRPSFYTFSHSNVVVTDVTSAPHRGSTDRK